MITVNFYRRTPLQVNFRIDTPVNVTGGGGGGVTDHGQLTGLDDDDHPQYFNQSRGDARYAQVVALQALDNDFYLYSIMFG